MRVLDRQERSWCSIPPWAGPQIAGPSRKSGPGRTLSLSFAFLFPETTTALEDFLKSQRLSELLREASASRAVAGELPLTFAEEIALRPGALEALSSWLRVHERPELADQVEIAASFGMGWRERLARVLNECARRR